MKYKDALKQSMELLGQHEKSVFIGYNTKYGSKANGSLININENKLIETPVAENLMMGLAIGMSLNGFLPLVYFERFDFILNAMDAIINHLNKIESLSNGEFKPRVIIRAVIGNINKPLYTGSTHTQDFTEMFKKCVSFPVIKLITPKQILRSYEKAFNDNSSYLLIEEKDRYEEE